MAQPKALTSSGTAIATLRDDGVKAVAQILKDLDPALKSEPRLFKSGIELIKVTLKVGNNIEFTVIIAGKDAPKVGQLASTSEQSASAMSGVSHEAR